MTALSRIRPVVTWTVLLAAVASPARAQPAGQKIIPTDRAIVTRIVEIRQAMKRGDVQKLTTCFAEQFTVVLNFGSRSDTKTMSRQEALKDFHKAKDAEEANLIDMVFGGKNVSSAIRYVVQLPGHDVQVRLKTTMPGDLFTGKKSPVRLCLDLIFHKQGDQYLFKSFHIVPKDFNDAVLKKVEAYDKANPDATDEAKMAYWDKLAAAHLAKDPKGGEVAIPPAKPPVKVPAKPPVTPPVGPPAPPANLRVSRVIKELPNPPAEVLPERLVTPAVRTYRKEVDQAIRKRYPRMANRQILETFLSFGRGRFYANVYQLAAVIRFGRSDFTITIRIVFTRSDGGRLNEWMIPIVTRVGPPPAVKPWGRWTVPPIRPAGPPAVRPPATTPVVRPPATPPTATATTCMVLTNLAQLKAKHGANYDRIVALLQRYGKILDTSSAGIDTKNFRAVDTFLEKNFDRRRAKYLLIFGHHDVVPFGVYSNEIFKKLDKDKDILSDDYYADFDHDQANDYDIVVTRLPDDPGILQSDTSVLFRPVPAGGLEYRNFAVYGNAAWKPAVEHYARMGNPTNPKLLLSPPMSRDRFSANYFRNTNVMIDMHGSNDPGTGYVSDNPGGGYVQAMGLQQAVAPGSVVFSGACYGGSIVGKDSRNHIGLRFLRNGARAFMGGTRIIYGGKVYQNVLGKWGTYFEQRVQQGTEPALAFMQAKRDFAKYYNTIKDPGLKAVEFKMLHQMVYYGLPPVGTQATAPGTPVAINPPTTPGMPVSPPTTPVMPVTPPATPVTPVPPPTTPVVPVTPPITPITPVTPVTPPATPVIPGTPATPPTTPVMPGPIKPYAPTEPPAVKPYVPPVKPVMPPTTPVTPPVKPVVPPPPTTPVPPVTPVARDYSALLAKPLADDNTFAESLYRCVLHAEPKADWVTRAVGKLSAGTPRSALITERLQSADYGSRNTDNGDFVRDVFQAVFGREPDQKNAQGWTAYLDKGGSRDKMISLMLASAAYQQILRRRAAVANVPTTPPTTPPATPLTTPATDPAKLAKLRTEMESAHTALLNLITTKALTPTTFDEIKAAQWKYFEAREKYRNAGGQP